MHDEANFKTGDPRAVPLAEVVIHPGLLATFDEYAIVLGLWTRVACAPDDIDCVEAIVLEDGSLVLPSVAIKDGRWFATLLLGRVDAGNWFHKRELVSLALGAAFSGEVTWAQA